MICKEALHNIARHAEAQHVEFSIQRDGKGLLIRIHDDGKGFDTRSNDEGNGLGNMRERAKQMHASLTLDSTANQGTTLQNHAPL